MPENTAWIIAVDDERFTVNAAYIQHGIATVPDGCPPADAPLVLKDNLHGVVFAALASRIRWIYREDSVSGTVNRIPGRMIDPAAEAERLAGRRAA